MKLCTIFAMFVTLTGCSTLKSIPPGTSIQSATYGLRFSPASVDGAPLVLGSHTFILTTPVPEGSGANLNRFTATAPGGITLKSTVATGSVGDELSKAGGPEALRFLLGNGNEISKPLRPIPLPLTQPLD